MTDSTIREIVQELFVAVFDGLEDRDVATLDRASDSIWDSMTHVALISALESEFDSAISLEQAAEISTFDDCVRLAQDLNRA